MFDPYNIFLKQDAYCWVNTHQNIEATRTQITILIGWASNTSVPAATAVSVFKAIGIFALEQNVIPCHITICDAAEIEKATQINGSESPINISPERNSATQ